MRDEFVPHRNRSVTDNQLHLKPNPMPYETPGVPNPEESATKMRELTKAPPEIPNTNEVRRYDQCLESPGPCHKPIFTYTD